MARKKESSTSEVTEEPVTRRVAGRGSAARPAAKTGKRRPAAKKKGASTKARSRKISATVEDLEPPAPAGTTSLVIVESPAKAKTIGKYLGRGYRVKATIGHLRDLPEKKLGIDIDKGFEPEYVTISGKRRRSPT